MSEAEGFYCETYPKVKAASYSLANKTMTLENKTVTIKLSVGDGTVYAYMESEGSMIYYQEITNTGLVGGSTKGLTFTQAMSCMEANTGYTKPDSGSYFRNVQFSNTTLYSIGSAKKPMPTAGEFTYFTFICRPNNISYVFDIENNTETVSIDYTAK